MNITIETPETSAELPTTICDADLLDAWIRDQHGQSLATLIGRYSVMVLSVCRRRCRSKFDAEDAYQTTFLHLARNASKIRRPECLPGWLHRVAQRAAIATLDTKNMDVLPIVDPPAQPDDPLDRLTQRHEAIVLDEELADLPEHYRAALVMHVLEERPLAEVAHHLGTTVGSIRGRLQRGKQLLARRLRSRGIVPVLAFAAVKAWTVSEAVATDTSRTMIDSATSGDLPEQPIDTSLLDSLLRNGTHAMNSLYTLGGVLCTAAVVTLLLVIDHSPAVGQPQSPIVMSLPAAPPSTDHGQLGHLAQIVGDQPKPQQNQPSNNSQGQWNEVQTASDPPQFWINKAVVPKPEGAIAKRAVEAMETDVDLNIEPTTIADLSAQLTTATGVPVLVDERGVAFAKLQPSSPIAAFDRSAIPLKTALVLILKPYGLKAVVSEEGITITADPATLVHKEIGTAQWINIRNDVAEEIAKTLQTKCDLDLVEIPLIEMAENIEAKYLVPVRVDDRALEEIGISYEQPVSGRFSNVSLDSALSTMLQDMDLTLTIRDESLVITTIEAAEASLLNRIYWLESTGFAPGDFNSIIQVIQTTIVPDTWEALGGSSTMSPLVTGRPAILVSTTYDVHESIDNLFRSLRQAHFGSDPVIEPVLVPASQVLPRNQMGGGFM
ncbi:MAG: sigma-70 family RNA polymerase sigma factor [Pirellulaceae bacterium]|nr:sigma-70 family RNA polymerase sigma factor [Pirellulaceae bacterium]